jgi:DNA-binding NtrC family response regulator
VTAWVPASDAGASAVNTFSHRVARFATARDAVLLLGPPGAGKTHLAEQLHEQSRRSGRFVRVAAASLTDELACARLEGHVRGAFTGAHQDSMGLIESANGGTLFIDEVATASAVVQTLLLDVLERGVICRVGEVRERGVNVRIIAATNADVDALIRAQRFRQDLRDRFGYFVLELPALAARPTEILPLAARFLAEAQREAGGMAPATLTPDVARLLQAAPWPGNVRELRAVCRYAVTMAGDVRPIGTAHLPPDFLATVRAQRRAVTRSPAVDARQAVEAAGGNKARAARTLRVSRTTLYEWLRLDASGSGPTADARGA